MESETQQVLREVVLRYPPSTFYNCGDFFRTLHKQIKGDIKQYSYRQLSVDLGFSPTNLVHLIVQGKRPVTERAAEKISSALDLQKEERRYFFALAQLTRDKDSIVASRTFSDALDIRQGMMSSRLTTEEMTYFSEWYHPVIREMILLNKFNEDPQWIAEHIKPAITPAQAAASMQLLEHLGLIKRDPVTRRFVQRERTLASGSEVQSLIKIKFQQETILHGIEAMNTIPVEDRQLSSMVLSVSKAQLEKIKQEIKVFQQKLLEIEAQGNGAPPECIVRLNLQLFPSCSF